MQMGRGATTLSFEPVAERRASAADLPLKDFIAASFRETVERKREEMKLIEADYETFSRTAWTGESYPFEIEISSSWASHGEEGSTTRFVGSLREAIKAASNAFKEQNNRSDVQGRYSVYVRLDNGTRIAVPEDYWRDYVLRYSIYPIEQISKAHQTAIEAISLDGPLPLTKIETLIRQALGEDDLELIDVTKLLDKMLSRRLVGWNADGQLELADEGLEMLERARNAPDAVRQSIYL